MEETKSTTIELKDIETMPQREFNDMMSEILKTRYPEADEVLVNMEKYYHGVDFLTKSTMSYRVKVNVQYN